MIQLLGDLTKTQRKKRQGHKSAASAEITLQFIKRTKTKNCKHSSSNVNMSNISETRETFLHAHSDNVIDDEEHL